MQNMWVANTLELKERGKNHQQMSFVDPSGYYGIPGAAYGAIAGGVGGYLASGRTWSGAVIGAIAGGLTGAVAPQFSNTAATAATTGFFSALSSFTGQMAANWFGGTDPMSNINVDAIVGAGIGGAWGSYGASVLSSSFLSGSSFQFGGQAAMEGFFVGGGEYLGNQFSQEFGGTFDFSKDSSDSGGGGALNPNNYSMGDFTF